VNLSCYHKQSGLGNCNDASAPVTGTDSRRSGPRLARVDRRSTASLPFDEGSCRPPANARRDDSVVTLSERGPSRLPNRAFACHV